MLIMECSAKWLIWMLKNSHKKFGFNKNTFELEQHLHQKQSSLQITKLKFWNNVKWLFTLKKHSQFESCEILNFQKLKIYLI
jgi:hypothetical protein